MMDDFADWGDGVLGAPWSPAPTAKSFDSSALSEDVYGGMGVDPSMVALSGSGSVVGGGSGSVIGASDVAGGGQAGAGGAWTGLVSDSAVGVYGAGTDGSGTSVPRTPDAGRVGAAPPLTDPDLPQGFTGSFSLEAPQEVGTNDIFF